MSNARCSSRAAFAEKAKGSPTALHFIFLLAIYLASSLAPRRRDARARPPRSHSSARGPSPSSALGWASRDPRSVSAR
eukprot:31018-Pelagococcus_subviridis.AAC.19